VRCEGEDSKYIGELSIWRTPENTTAGRTSRRNWPRKATSGRSDCSQAIESGQRSMFIAQRAGKPWGRPPRLMDRRDCSGFNVRFGLARGSGDEVAAPRLRSWLGSRRYVGASHGSRRALLLPGRIGDMDRRERPTLDIMSIAAFGAKLAAGPGDLAARDGDDRRT
jgi:hypothetical protein